MVSGLIRAKNMVKRKFDHLIHAPNRLQICAFLEAVEEIEFTIVRDQLNVSDSVLSKHIKSLQDEDYVLIDKRTSDGRQRTWLSLTSKGRKAYIEHVNELKNIISR
jgi:DNA-binding MarR family transcriptional regulator